jgi:hypothetical protein
VWMIVLEDVPVCFILSALNIGDQKTEWGWRRERGRF